MQRLRTRLRASASRGAPAALSLDFLSASGTLDPRITFSRGSNATLTDSTGKITYAPTNLLTNSESFDNAGSWIKSAIGVGTAPTVTANAGVAPDGTTTADLVTLVNTGTTLSDWSWIYQNTTPAANTTYIFSVWLKAATPSDVGKVVIITGIPTDSVTLTANWQRVFWRGTAPSTSTISSGIRLRGVETATTSASFLMWGADLEPVTYQTTPGTYNSTTPKNLLGFTQEFDNAAWTKTNATVTANAVYAPDGTLTADKLVENTVNGQHELRWSNTFLTGGVYTLSVYAKSTERNLLVYLDGYSGGRNFDLTNGTVGAVVGTAPSSASITSLGNGWYRCSITVTWATGSTSNIRLITLSGTTNSYTGDGTSGIFIWGAQLSDSASLDPYVYNPAAAAASAAYYGPRFDYDPVTLAAKGLLIEEQRTNLLTYSEQFDNGAWLKAGATVTANSTTSPDGTLGADTLIEDSTNNVHAISESPAISPSTTYTWTVYAKRGPGSRNLYLQANFNSGTVGAGFAWFDLATGVATAPAVLTAPFTGVASSMSPVGNGWYRCTFTFTTNAGNTSVTCYTALYNAGRVYTGDGTSGVYLYGAQLEAGSFATSYIPTVASQVTRSADVATMIGDNFRSWYNQNAGTFTVDVDSATTGYRTNLQVDDGTLNNRILIQTNNVATAQQYYVVVGGSAVVNTSAQSYSPSGSKTSAAYALNDYAYSVNGATPTADTSATVPVVNRLFLGTEVSSNYLNGHIRSLGYYNTRQPNATLQTLTNPSTTPSLALNFISDTYTVGA